MVRFGRLVTSERERMILADVRLAVERLALRRSEQLQWLARQRLGPIELVESLVRTLRAALSEWGDDFSRALRLRLEAMEGELTSLSCGGDATPETPGSHPPTFELGRGNSSSGWRSSRSWLAVLVKPRRLTRRL